MKNFFLAFVVFLLWAFLGMAYYSCVIKGLCPDLVFWTSGELDDTKTLEVEKDRKTRELAQRQNDSIAVLELEKIAANAEISRIKNLFSSTEFLALSRKEKDTIFYYQNPITIYKDQAKVYVPEYNRRFNNDVSEYFALKMNTELIIYGAYDPNKENSTTDSLGIARALYLKERLVRSGLNPDRIETMGVQQELNFDSRERNYQGIAMEFKELSNERIAAIEEGVAHKILFSAFAQETFRPDATLRNYAYELKVYLEKYTTKTVQVIGHTDNIGNDIDNKWIGQQRADNVRSYLISKGVDGAKIIARSLGEAEPFLPNTTEANRAKNRRIEIKVN